MAVSERELNELYNQLRDSRRQIAELQQQMKQQSNEFQQYIEELSKRMKESTVNAQNDMIRRWQAQEAEMCRVYTLEVEELRNKYRNVLDKVKAQEIAYERALQELEQNQKEELAKIERQNARNREEAMKQAEAFNKVFLAAEKEPVEIFFPHKLANYKKAGERAVQLMQEGLFVLAANDYSICYLGVENLIEDTRTKVNDIHTMFTLYRSILSRIQILQEEAWELPDNIGEVCLSLETSYDKEYWADMLYAELNRIICEYQRIADDGEDAWIRSSVGRGISPELLLDQKIRSLEYIPTQLQVCINYALSACDSYNAFNSIFTSVNNVMREQNYLFEKITYGSCREGNDRTEGYQYYRRWLDEEECIELDKEPDYRETRCMLFTNMFGCECRIYMVPVRSENHIGYRLFIDAIQKHLPKHVQAALQHVLSDYLQKEVQFFDVNEIRRLNGNRIMTMDELKVLAAVPSEEKLKAKYCVGL